MPLITKYNVEVLSSCTASLLHVQIELIRQEVFLNIPAARASAAGLLELMPNEGTFHDRPLQGNPTISMSDRGWWRRESQRYTNKVNNPTLVLTQCIVACVVRARHKSYARLLLQRNMSAFLSSDTPTPQQVHTIDIQDDLH